MQLAIIVQLRFVPRLMLDLRRETRLDPRIEMKIGTRLGHWACQEADL